jgi:hypothetical protein
MTSFSNLTRSSPVTHLTWTTPSSTELPVTSYSNFTLSPPVTHLTWTPLVYRQQNNSITEIEEQSKNKNKGDTILWISLGAAALVVILTAFIILFCQRYACLYMTIVFFLKNEFSFQSQNREIS